MVKPGYKQTEIGMVPTEWDIKPAKDLMKIETGSKNTEHKTDYGQYPFFVRSQQVERIDSYHYDCEAVLTAGDGVGTGKVFHYIFCILLFLMCFLFCFVVYYMIG